MVGYGSKNTELLEDAFMRTEQHVFDELAVLCGAPGYVHAIAYLCFRDNIIRYFGDVKAEDLSRMSSMENLSRTELSTLIGLMVKSAVDDSIPDLETLQSYVQNTDRLMLELHEAMSAASFKLDDWKKMAEEGRDPFHNGEAFREPIFYSGDSAYHFQYRDLAPLKYQADNAWLKANKGFDIHVAKNVTLAIERIQSRNIPDKFGKLRTKPLAEWTFLPCFTFTSTEVAAESKLDEKVVEAVLRAFTVPAEERNNSFKSLHDFNVANALPLIQRGDKKYVLLQAYSMSEALYEAPFYWMMLDKAYQGTATNHRGQFAEAYAEARLVSVFGAENVYANVHVLESKGKELSEIDVLVAFGNRAIIVQAKSKRLTIEARKGNDKVIKDDFKKSVQDAYDQGFLCAAALADSAYKLVDTTGKELTFSRNFKEVYILCVVSDNYPALSFQARQFLKHQRTEIIMSPFVLDIFTLDAIAEMLPSPLRFLSYLNRRTALGEKVFAAQELTILSYHLKKNLWVDGEFTMISLDGSITADLDLAMSVRREGIPGKATPDGILTAFTGTNLGLLIEDIEAKPDHGTIDLGFLLLALSDDAIKEANRLIEHAAKKARQDGETHDVTWLFDDVGLTVHVNDRAQPDAMEVLQRHCEGRKYTLKTSSWLGICLSVDAIRLRFGLRLDYPWKQDSALDELTKDLPKPNKGIWNALSKSRRRMSAKVGRNDPCPCGSGLKYKKCCLE
jgi:hypothetical protein